MAQQPSSMPGFLCKKELNKPGASFAGYLMWYPGCLALPDLDLWDQDLLQIYIGEDDNWTPAEPCVDLVKKINLEGGNASIELYPNSFHSFDGPMPLGLYQMLTVGLIVN